MSDNGTPGPSRLSIANGGNRVVDDDDPTFFPDDYSSSNSSEEPCVEPTTATLPINQYSRPRILEQPGGRGPPTGELRDQFDAWDPQEADYNSVQNLLGSDIGQNAGAFALGVKDKAKAWSEVPCPFYTGEGNFCWKGPSCRMLHVIVDPTDLGRERISTSYTLDDKPILHLGMWIQVMVQHVVSPSEFYVIPVDSATCICESAFLPKEKTDQEPDNLHKNRGNMDKIRVDSMLEEFGTGVKAFETMQLKLKDILELNFSWRNRQTPYYAKSQLVAVKVSDQRVRTWYRAVVVEENVTHVVDRQLPFHVVTLMDIGKTLTVRANDLCPLPVSLSFYPAMAFKCCLNGVVPVGMRWASGSTKTFASLTTGQTLLMTVSKPHEYDGVCKIYETRPYLVDLLIHTSKVPEDLRPTYHRPSISIAEVLSENGKAIKLNNFPHRPQLHKFVCHNNDLLLLPLNAKTLPMSTQKEESVRAFDVLAGHIMKLKTSNNSKYNKLKRSKSF